MSSKHTVKITKAAWDKMWEYIIGCDKEIEGLGMAYLPIDRDPEASDKDIVVEDVFILKQAVSAASADIDEEYVHTKMFEMTKAKDMRAFNFWWHSHAKMNTFFSGTDENTINKFGNADWMVHFVGNHAMQYTCKITIYKPFKVEVLDCPVEILGGPAIVISDEVQKDLDELVSEKTWATAGFNSPYGYWSGGTFTPYSEIHKNREFTLENNVWVDKNTEEVTSLSSDDGIEDDDFDPKDLVIGDRVWVETDDSIEWKEGIITSIIESRTDDLLSFRVHIDGEPGVQEVDSSNIYPTELYDIKPADDVEDDIDDATFNKLESLDQMATALCKEEKYEEAIEVLNKMLELDKDQAENIFIVDAAIEDIKEIMAEQEEELLAKSKKSKKSK